MTIQEIQQEILRMKKEQDVCILAHAYQGQEILEVADYMGDSYGLSVQASKSNCKGVIMCGVRFMAETCKVLSPEKKVWPIRQPDVQWQNSWIWRACVS
jgi:quinolinate synthase